MRDVLLRVKAEALVRAVDVDRLAQAVALQTVIDILTGDTPNWSTARRMADALADRAPSETAWLAHDLVELLRGAETDSQQVQTDAWEAFWRAYPRKQAKQAARTAWRALKPTPALAATITDAVRRQATSEDWRKDGGRFIPHAATYLRGRRWEDAPGPSLAPEGPTAAEAERARTLEILRERMRLFDRAAAGDVA